LFAGGDEIMILESSNFREIRAGAIPPNVLYRSNHPIFNGNQVDNIILSAIYAKIKTVINLSDNTYTLRSKVAACLWYKNIFDNDNVIALHINMKFDPLSREFCNKIKEGLLFMDNRHSPYLIHCEAGIDRTGFLAIILEALMGANIHDLAEDYMLSFMDKSEFSPDGYKYGSIFIRNLFARIKSGFAENYENWQDLALKYLMENVGMTDYEINQLEKTLSEKTMF
jgi:protein tyrosine/serine phosphatase